MKLARRNHAAPGVLLLAAAHVVGQLTEQLELLIEHSSTLLEKLLQEEEQMLLPPLAAAAQGLARAENEYRQAAADSQSGKSRVPPRSQLKELQTQLAAGAARLEAALAREKELKSYTALNEFCRYSPTLLARAGDKLEAALAQAAAVERLFAPGEGGQPASPLKVAVEGALPDPEE